MPTLITALQRSFVRVWHRFLLLILSPLLLIASALILYVFLPFPGPTNLEADALERLQEGRWVTRVYRADSLLLQTANDPEGLAQYGRSFFALQFALGSNPSELLFLAPNGTLATLPIPIGDKTVHCARLPASVGDPDGVSLPWFPPADAAMLWTAGGSYLPDRAREQEATLLVATTAIAQDDGSVALTVHTATASNSEGVPATVAPLLSLFYAPGAKLAKVALSPPGRWYDRSAREYVENEPTVFAPSWTLPLRMLILETIIFCVFAAEEAIRWGIKLALWFCGALLLVVAGWIVKVASSESSKQGAVRLSSPTKTQYGAGLPVVIITDDGLRSGPPTEKDGF